MTRDMNVLPWIVFLLLFPGYQCLVLEPLQINNVLTRTETPSDRLDALEDKKTAVEEDMNVLFSDVTGLKTSVKSCLEVEKQLGVLTTEKTAADHDIEQLSSEVSELTSDLGICKKAAEEHEIVVTEKNAATAKVEDLSSENNELKSSLAACLDNAEKQKTAGSSACPETVTNPDAVTNPDTVTNPDAVTNPDQLQAVPFQPEPVGCPDDYTLDKPTMLCFKIVTDVDSDITNAKKYCGKSNGRLIVLNTQEKFNAILQRVTTAAPGRELWVGAERSDDGTFSVWSDGHPIDAGMWNEGEPNNWGGKESCMSMDGRRGFLVNDTECSVPFNFICEVPLI